MEVHHIPNREVMVMNKMLSTVEFEREVATAIKPVMSRKEKLLHFAKIVREHPGPLALYNGLEHWTEAQMKACAARGHNTALALASTDPSFEEQGIGETVHSIEEFFELSQNDLHAFSCDCGGAITNEDMARRIENIANR